MKDFSENFRKASLDTSRSFVKTSTDALERLSEKIWKGFSEAFNKHSQEALETLHKNHLEGLTRSFRKALENFGKAFLERFLGKQYKNCLSRKLRKGFPTIFEKASKETLKSIPGKL